MSSETEMGELKVKISADTTDLEAGLDRVAAGFRRAGGAAHYYVLWFCAGVLTGTSLAVVVWTALRILWR